MRILLKYPTRSRPAVFKETLTRYLDTAECPLTIIVSIDKDDAGMLAMKPWAEEMGCQVCVGPRRTKIQAINADIPKEGWDILVLASDDHLPVVMGWDTRVKADMPADLDALLFYKDIKQETQRTCLMPIMGRVLHDFFGNIYDPAFKSLWCDNYQTEVAESRGKLIRIDSELFRNESPDWGGMHKRDRLYQMNNSYYSTDQRTYKRLIHQWNTRSSQ